MSESANFPSIRPSLLLDFANAKVLDPRVTFTRASTAVYYDGDAVAKAEENLLTYSQNFDNSAWIKFSSSATADTTAAPDGSTTADTITASAGTSVRYVQPQNGVGIVGVSYTASIYAKAGTHNFLQLSPSSGGTGIYANFNLSTGVVGNNAGVTAAIISVGNGWYRCSVTFTSNHVDNVNFVYWLVSSATSARGESWTAAGTETIYLWGAQLEQRSSVTAYTATTSAATTKYAPQLLTAASGEARFTHDPVTRESLGLLIEESRTNLVTYSEQLDTWTKTSATVTANATVAPDGTLTADKYVLPATVFTGSSTVSQVVTKAATATTYTFGAYTKAGGFNSVRVYVRDNATSANVVATVFNLATEAVVSEVVAGTFTAVSSTIKPCGGGWYRCSITFTSSTETTISPRFYVYNNGTTVAGDDYSGIYIWGAQLEAGSFATSYIPTTSAQVTRASDSASMTGANFSSWYNQSEGSIYSEFSTVASTNFPQVVSINDNTNVTTIAIDAQSGVRSLVVVNNITQALFSSTNIASGNKMSLSYRANDFASSFNGSAPSTDASGVLFTATQMGIGNRIVATNLWLNGTIKKLAYYPARLPNAQLQALTLS